MSLSKKLYNYDKEVARFLKRNIAIIIFLFLFAFGTIIGSYLIKESELGCYELISKVAKAYIKSKGTNSLASNFLTSFAVNLMFIFTAFNVGLCVIGIPFITLIPIIKGISIGVISGYLYLTYAFTGLGYCALILYPGAIMSILSIVLSCQLSVNCSYMLLKNISSFKNTDLEGEESLKIYFVKYIFLLLLSAMASVTDAVTIKLFSNLFRF